MSVAEGNGPVNALDLALRKDLGKYQGEIDGPRTGRLQGAHPQRRHRSRDARPDREPRRDSGERWSTVGVSDNIIDASFQALMDSIVYKLVSRRAGVTAGRSRRGSMIDHVSIGVRDLDRAARFYEAVLGALGYARLEIRPAHRRLRQDIPGVLDQPAADHGAASPATAARMWGCARAHGRAGRRVPCRGAGRRRHVDGAPGLRPQHGEGYYAAFIRDPDGNRLEAVTFVETAG